MVDQAGRSSASHGIEGGADLDLGHDRQVAGGDLRAERVAKRLQLDGGRFGLGAAKPDREAVAVDMGHRPRPAEAGRQPLGELLERGVGGLRDRRRKAGR